MAAVAAARALSGGSESGGVRPYAQGRRQGWRQDGRSGLIDSQAMNNQRLGWIVCVPVGLMLSLAQQSVPANGEQLYGSLCAGCHGAGASGGNRGPALVNSRTLRMRSQAQIRDLIRSGTP